MKVLLIGNIANNSYNNAKFLRRRGVEADVLCCNYSHVMGQPEWEDADFNGKVDQLFPDWDQVDLNGFQRPQWFRQDEIVPINTASPQRRHFSMLASCLPLTTSSKKMLTYLLRVYSKSRFKLKIAIPLKRRLAPFIFPSNKAKVIAGVSNTNAQSAPKPLPDEADGALDIEKMIGEFKASFPWREDLLTHMDIKAYCRVLPWFRRIFKAYDLIHACATDPIYAMLATPSIPYVAFEHGTLRDIPFEDSRRGRLLSLAYKKAAQVIITNPDTITSARKLGLQNYQFVPHPLDQDKYCPAVSTLTRELRSRYSVESILFSPSRHDWDVKGNDLLIRGFATYLKRTNLPTLLIFTLWGDDIGKSKRLIRKLGIKNAVVWLPLLNETNHIKYLNAADIVLDQMLLASFGGIAFKAMSCGKPVISSYRHENNRWCLEEAPPLVGAYTSEEVALNIKEIIENKGLREHIGRKGREWILKHHSWELVADRLIDVYEQALKRHPKGERDRPRVL